MMSSVASRSESFVDVDSREDAVVGQALPALLYKRVGGCRTGGCEYYYNARWYDPELGRFISEDPIMDGPNWYAYVANNPLMKTDPTGLLSPDHIVELVDQAILGNTKAAQLAASYMAPPVMQTINPRALAIRDTMTSLAKANPGNDTCTPVFMAGGNRLGLNMTPLKGLNANGIHDKLLEMSKTDPDVKAVTAGEAQAAADAGEWVPAVREQWVYTPPGEESRDEAGHVAVVVTDLSRTHVTDKGFGMESPRVVGGGLTALQLQDRKSQDASFVFSFHALDDHGIPEDARPDYYIYSKKQP